MNDYKERTNRQAEPAVFSINDPRWGRGDGNGVKNDSKRPQDGKRPNGKDEGPPDLDEMWREFNRRIAGVFGRKPGNGAPRENGRGTKIGLGIVIGVLIAIYLGSGVFVVQDGHVGVVSQFGQYRQTVAQGIHWRLPYPFQSSEIVDTSQIRSVEVGRGTALSQGNVRDASLLTNDADIVDVRFAVQYQIKSPTDFLFRSINADDSVTQAAQSAIREIAGSLSTDDMLYKDREALRARLIETIQRSLDTYRTGLQVTGVAVQSVQVPQQVQSAFEEAARVRQDNERARDTAQAYADQLLPRAKADAAKLIDEARAYSNREVTQAQGDAERFKEVYAEYSKAPAVIRQRMYLDTMQQIYSRTTKVFVDSKAGNNVVYLPLDKLVEANRQQVKESADAASGAVASGASEAPQARAQGAASASAPAAVAPASAASGASANAGGDPLRSRDAFRSRSRQDDLQ
ncbi:MULTISPECIES: FtsH protease activity modulator HflK [Caballeronia]|uniref:Protein HflK n=1 Tax=Caballeronia zhejiangensis TaxID=871203 RepID=A0A656QEP4_9BURK|nr:MULTISPECIES: FtsH protease activity modulator HflK [Caballeronia]EKS67633.1 HflK protein [Burkholderia sp. SJ98]KDR26063.1 membrane protein [Caballeronia zhejiangensis]MCG7403714.1 FtsH protease activity modulator HflK [Caballeronia zhejiangensis]MDR5765335.1 FtsH protease activity modulator HflK [Caballeronia sp. LZ028]MDR5787188.1 FtsH protease activity modulator HflK [Caballeronia sp. LP003]